MGTRIKSKSWHYFYLLTAFSGMAFLFWSIPVYNLTFIPLRHLLLIMGTVTLVTTMLTIYKFKSAYAYGSAVAAILAVCWNLLSWGFLCTSIFLFSNYYLSGGEIQRKEFAILERSEHPGKKGERENLRPAFTIAYRGIEKELVFAHRFYKWKDDYKSAILTLQRGKWGFEVIRGKAVTK